MAKMPSNFLYWSEPKNPSLTIYLKPDDEVERQKAQTIMYNLEYTKLVDIVDF
jgi:hypothetical protein